MYRECVYPVRYQIVSYTTYLVYVLCKVCRMMSHAICVCLLLFVTVVAGATMAGLSNEAELLGAMHIGRLLMRRGMW